MHLQLSTQDGGDKAKIKLLPEQVTVYKVKGKQTPVRSYQRSFPKYFPIRDRFLQNTSEEECRMRTSSECVFVCALMESPCVDTAEEQSRLVFCDIEILIKPGQTSYTWFQTEYGKGIF